MATALSGEAAQQNEDLIAQVTEMADRYRDGGQIGDLVRLRDLRVRAGQRISDEILTGWAGDEEEIPPQLFESESSDLPEIDVRELSIEALRSAMHHNGALIVRNFFSPREAFDYQREIEGVIEAAREHHEFEVNGEPEVRSTNSKARFLPLKKPASEERGGSHAFLGKSGAIETFLSPRVSAKLLDSFENQGLRGLLQAYFQDEPCLSFKKSVLRRSEPLKHPAEWHQDGAFMNKGIQSLNLWISLTDCGDGTESPGMDLIPRRLTSVLPTGTNGAIFDWSVSGATVVEAFPDTTPARPFFAAGDAVFFDHFNLHATSSSPAFTQPRYAIETWFFSKSRCALNQTPVFW